MIKLYIHEEGSELINTITADNAASDHSSIYPCQQEGLTPVFFLNSREK